jgi:hypothetical protein
VTRRLPVVIAIPLHLLFHSRANVKWSCVLLVNQIFKSQKIERNIRCARNLTVSVTVIASCLLLPVVLQHAMAITILFTASVHCECAL